MSAIELQGFAWNPAPRCLPPLSDDHRVYIHLVVEGRAHALRTGETLGPGQVLWLRSAGDTFGPEPLAFVDHHLALALRLDPALVGPWRGPERCAVPVDRLRELHGALLLARGPEQGAALARELLCLLSAAGLPLLGEVLVKTPGETSSELSLASGLSHALTVDASRPTLVDLLEDRAGQGSHTERHVRRRLGRFLERYCLPFAGWRELKQSFCLTTAALAMSVPGARTDRVSRASGFSSATALCHALSRSGLAPPQQLAAAAQGLRANL